MRERNEEQRLRLLLERLCPVRPPRQRRGFPVRTSDGCIFAWGKWYGLLTFIRTREQKRKTHELKWRDPEYRKASNARRVDYSRTNPAKQRTRQRDWYQRNKSVAREREYERRRRRRPTYGIKTLIDRVARGDADVAELDRRLREAIARADDLSHAKQNEKRGLEERRTGVPVREEHQQPDPPKARHPKNRRPGRK